MPTPPKRIVAADDNRQIRDLLTVYLRHGGYDFAITEDGRHALAAIRARRPDLVVLDIGLPDLDGYQVLAEIRADPALAGLPVVALTSYATAADRERALAAGFDGFLTKPIQMQSLLADLARFL